MMFPECSCNLEMLGTLLMPIHLLLLIKDKNLTIVWFIGQRKAGPLLHHSGKIKYKVRTQKCVRGQMCAPDSNICFCSWLIMWLGTLGKNLKAFQKTAHEGTLNLGVIWSVNKECHRQHFSLMKVVLFRLNQSMSLTTSVKVYYTINYTTNYFFPWLKMRQSDNSDSLNLGLLFVPSAYYSKLWLR